MSEISFEKPAAAVKNLFSGKKKWIIIGGIGVVGLVFFLNRNKGNQAGVSYIDSYPTTSTSGATDSTQLSALSDTFSSQIENMQQKYTDAMTAQQNNFQKQLDALANQQAANAASFSDALNSVSSDFSSQLDHFDSKITQWQATPTGGTSSATGAGVTTPQTQNQITYLTNTKAAAQASGNKGLETWSNQQLYLENLKATGTAGQKSWATAQLAKG